VPIGAYAVIEDDQIWLRGLVGSVDGKQILHGEIRGEVHNAQSLGIELADHLLEQGADKILAQVYEQAK
jgi:hydroxymethylbilane synthase